MAALKQWACICCVVLLAACAHPISMAPDMAKMGSASAAARPGTVGLYISAEDRSRQVTTPGGGGDKVSYYPYRDLESAIYKVLGTLYERVVVVQAPGDVDALTKNGVSVVARPQIITQSSSQSALTWPPTFFQVQITCVVTDIAGAKIAETFVTGTGRAEFDEFKSDFSLAAKRASEDALRQTQAALSAEKALQ